MIKTYCDRCGKEIITDIPKETNFLSIKLCNCDVLGNKKPIKEYDLCNNCLTEIYIFINYPEEWRRR